MMRPDKELVKVTLEHDLAEFEFLIRRYEKSVFATVVPILGNNRHTAEDVVQDTFIAAYEKLHTLRNPDLFGAWLLQIARRQAIRATKAQRKYRSLETDVAAPCINGQPSEESQYLLEGLAQLPDHERVVVMLKYFENLSVQSIASTTGCSVGTVTKQLTRARKRLSKHLTLLERHNND